MGWQCLNLHDNGICDGVGGFCIGVELTGAWIYVWRWMSKGGESAERIKGVKKGKTLEGNMFQVL